MSLADAPIAAISLLNRSIITVMSGDATCAIRMATSSKWASTRPQRSSGLQLSPTNSNSPANNAAASIVHRAIE